MDPHQNIFYYYSRHKSKDGEIFYDRQLENNTTKALINILENTNPNIVNAFLSYFLKKKLPKCESFHFCLQRKPTMLIEPKSKILLCITPEKSVDKETGGPGGIPDAWIYDLKGNIMIAIESKIKGGVSKSQINGHLRMLRWNSHEWE